MLRRTITLFRIRGIPVGVSWTWVFVAVLVVWSLAADVFPSQYPGRAAWTYALMGAVGALLFFASILLHELSHTLVAVHEGTTVEEVTLWLFGGVSKTQDLPATPAAEFRVVAAGPAATAAVVVVCWTTAAVGRAVGLADVVVGVPRYLAGINLVLLVFNIVPALPLDGGRLLHAFLWRRSGDRASATVRAGAASRAFAFVLIGIGMLGLLAGGSGLAAVWFVFLGWFLLMAVEQEVASALLERSLRGLTVRDLMARDPIVVPAAMTVDELLAGVARRSPHGAYPVVDADRLAGLVTVRAATAVARDERATTSVAAVMVPRSDVALLTSDEAMSAAVASLAREPGRAVVVDGTSTDRVVGLVSISDLSRAMERGSPAPPSHRVASR